VHHKIQIQIASSLKVTASSGFSVCLYVSGAEVDKILLSYVEYFLSGTIFKVTYHFVRNHTVA
jgi:hypothetical protein